VVFAVETKLRSKQNLQKAISDRRLSGIRWISETEQSQRVLWPKNVRKCQGSWLRSKESKEPGKEAQDSSSKVSVKEYRDNFLV